MNDEIKEILDFKENADYKRLSCDEIKVLKDYINNLQQENDKLLNENIVIKDVKYMVEETIYKSRCEKAIEYIEKFWKEESYYESIENCLQFATMNEFEKEDLLNILQNGSDDNE